MTVYAPYAGSYATHTPYITAAEYLASPTGVNIAQLIPRGTPAENANSLEMTIARASSFVDTICRQILAATIDTQSGRYRVQRTRIVRVPVDKTPIVSVEKIRVGYSPSTISEIRNYQEVWIDRKVVTFPLDPTPVPWANSGLIADGKVNVILEYVNGYANTLTTAGAVAGATTLVLNNVLGVVPGSQLTIYDPGFFETVTVTEANPATNTVTLSAPLFFDHSAGVNASALPAAVKQAVVLLTSALIKTRGSEAVVMQQMRTSPSQTAPIEDGGLEEIALAKQLLEPYVRAI